MGWLALINCWLEACGYSGTAEFSRSEGFWPFALGSGLLVFAAAESTIWAYEFSSGRRW